MSFAIGIDLGSTFSVVSYVNDNDQAEVIPNDLGERITPSVVALEMRYMLGNMLSIWNSICPFLILYVS